MPTLDSSSSGINFANVDVELICKLFKVEYDSSKKESSSRIVVPLEPAAEPLTSRKFCEMQKSQRKSQQASYMAANNNSDHLLLTQEALARMVHAARQNEQEGEYVKKILRQNTWTPLFSPIRKYLWKCLTTMKNDQSEIKSLDEYNSDLNKIFGKSRDIDAALPEFVNAPRSSSPSFDSHLNYYFLNREGKQAIKRILSVYEYHYPQVTFSPCLVSLASLLLHYMQEHEVFAALTFMASTHEHIIESKKSWDINSAVFVKLLKEYCKSSHDLLVKHVSSSDQVDVILSDWYWWIFNSMPFEYLVKIMDCYLFEGQKVLFRVALAIVQHFCKNAKTENFKVTKDSIKQFCQSSSSFESIDALLKTSFSIRNLSRSAINEFYQKEEAKRKTVVYSLPSKEGDNYELSNMILSVHTTDSNNNLVNVVDSSLLCTDATEATSPTSRIFLSETSTSILSYANLLTIWYWIPQRLSTYAPKMLFTTQEHGTSLNTLYNILDQLEYCLLVIKTLQNEIFGAFCSGSWYQRRKEKTLYFGNGETFLFRLLPEEKVYKWVGIRTKTKVATHQELFIRADSTKIAIGGGGNDGLAIKPNLVEGQTNRCDTFENEPLSSSQTFDIQILEVIAFSSNQHH